MSLYSLALRALALLFIASSAHVTAAATRIELVIDEATQNRTVAWPVTTGVPFPLGGLVKAEQCRLVDDTGAEQPLQSKVAATWDAARTSIRWLTIDFIAHPQRKYALEFGPEIERSIFASKLQVADAGDAGDSIGFDSKARVAVATGPLHVEFSQRGVSSLNAVRGDLNGDGKIEANERIVGGDAHQFIDQRNNVWTSGRDGADRRLTVESHGPVRACIRVDGWYTGHDGKRIVAYRTRYHLFAGLSVVKLIDEFRVIGSTRELQFTNIELPLLLDLDVGKQSVTTAEAKFDRPNATISAIQETYRHYGNPECRAWIEESNFSGVRRQKVRERIGPWMQVSDDRIAVTGSLRNFVEQFPKQWSAVNDQFTLNLWSERADPLDFGKPGLEKFFGPAGAKYLLNWKSGGGSNPISDFFYYAGRHGLERDGADGRGINKHHEIWYHFGRASEAAAGREYGALADKQPLCLATGAWNVGTGVFGPLAARPNDSPYEKIFDNIFDLQRKAQDDFGDYGWYLFGAGPHYSYQWDKETQRHYADPRRFEYHTYQRETQYWWSYLRSGERKFYDWCFPSENHWVDIAVSHVPLMYSTEWRGGAKGDAKLHYPAGDWSIDSPLHYVRHHDTGEAWLRSASQYWGSYHRTLETTTLAYYLTGDERYNDVVQFWKDYWGALAGIRSDSTTAKPWHMDQMWWEPTSAAGKAAGEPTKTWAEMIRDYAPFQSGSRHQQTLFFNLSTLYEHTWDPTIKQVLDEYAQAFIKPENPNGVWQCQDHHLPANADSPLLAHYWAPALWKYARASGDPRMPEVLKKYFTACLDADPYGCDVGIYSNNQIAWAWYFTKDPRALAAAQHQLDKLLPFAQPPSKPEDLGGLIYNPYMPIMISATVPRAIGILAEAKAQGVAVPPAPLLEPQRTLIAIANPPGPNRGGVLWGWDDKLEVVDELGRPCATRKVAVHRSHKQPFDRALPGFQVFRTEFTAIGDVGRAWSYVSPKLETGVLTLDDDRAIVWCWAGEPIQLERRRTWYWRRPSGAKSLVLEAARGAYVQVAHEGNLLPMAVVKNRTTYDLSQVPADALVTIDCPDGNERWFTIVESPDAERWVSAVKPVDREGKSWPVPPTPTKLLEARRKPTLEVDGIAVAGRFGKAISVSAGTEFRIPDEHTAADGKRTRLSDQRQGCLEFWIRRLGDERTEYLPGQMIMQAGSIYASLPKHVPLDEWTHVAVDWYPQLGRPEQSLVSVYVNGVDHGNYRSIYWDGYGDRVGSFNDKRPWLGAFDIVAPPNAPFLLDDVRLSNAPRYTDPTTKFGRAQTFNPKSFTPPTKPAELDGTTVMLAPLDDATGNEEPKLTAQTKLGPVAIGVIRKKK